MPSALARPAAIHPTAASLAALETGRERCIERLELPDQDASALRSMGIAEGQTVWVLRRAPGGDPLHIRLGNGGEFALAAPVARCVIVGEVP